MFATIARSARTLFCRLAFGSGEVAEATPSNQLQSELYIAALEASMVITRSQDHSQKGLGSTTALDSNDGSQERKRRNVEEISAADVVAKRRRSSSSSGDLAGRNVSPELGEDTIFVADSQQSPEIRNLALRTVDSQETPSQSLLVVASETSMEAAPETQVVEESQFAREQSACLSEANLESHSSEAMKARETVSSADGELSATPEIPQSIPPSRFSSSDPPQTTTLPTKIQEQSNGFHVTANSGPHVSQRPTHHRFGSEELVTPESVPHSNGTPAITTIGIQDEVSEKQNSDDEAPETVTASVGQDQARVATAEATKAVQR